MQISLEYIAGFFDGEGSVSTVAYKHRVGIASTIVTISQTGDEGRYILAMIRDFLWERGIKGYVHSQVRRYPHRQMHHYKISARTSTTAFLALMLPRVSVKRVVVQDTLRFHQLYPSLRGPVTAARNEARGKYGALGLDRAALQAAIDAGVTKTELARRHDTTTYTIHKYLDPDYRQRYDAYRKRWQAKRRAATAA